MRTMDKVNNVRVLFSIVGFSGSARVAAESKLVVGVDAKMVVEVARKMVKVAREMVV